MDERPRFTGTNPPPRLWDRFPNWQNAYDEEGEPGQDETTLRPADNQRAIDDDVSCTAADAVFADGRKVPALLHVACGELALAYVYPDPGRDECWAIRYDVPSGRWVAENDDWFLELEGVIPVPVDDAAVFPIRLIGRRPLERSNEPIAVEIGRPG